MSAVLVPWTPDDALAEGLFPYAAAERSLELPDAAWRLADGSATLAYWANGPIAPDGAATCALGRLQGASPEAVETLVAAALTHHAPAVRILAPLNGATWFAYRVVTQTSAREPFLLEPTPNAAVADGLARAGFAPISHYVSIAMATPDAVPEDPSSPIALRGVDADAFTANLDAIHAVASAAFAQAPYASPLDAERFRALYGPAAALADPRFTVLAEGEDGAPLGFLFAYPDADALIMKTIAVHPHAQGHGLGERLTAHGVRAAKAAGLANVIFATMHEDAVSAQWAGERGATIRAYALLGREP